MMVQWEGVMVREECDGLEGSVLNPHVCVLWYRVQL